MNTQTEEGKNIVSADVVTRTYCELKDDDRWYVTQTITQKRKIEDVEEWEEKTLKISASAVKLETALLNALISIDAYLSPRNNDLFQEPLDEVPEVKDKTDTGEYVN